MDDVFAKGSELPLRLGVITLFLAYVIYTYMKRRREYEACQVPQLCFNISDLVLGRHIVWRAAWLHVIEETPPLQMAFGP